MYHKLGNIPNPNLDSLGITKLRNNYGETINGVFRGLQYFEIDKSTENKILEMILPQKYHEHFDVLLLVINTPYVYPHTDSHVQCVINYYIQTGDATTIFWKCNENTQSYKLTNQTNGSVYNECDLTKQGQFHANNYDVWLLDVKQIHSVIGPSDKTRIAYCLCSRNLNYNELLTTFGINSI